MKDLMLVWAVICSKSIVDQRSNNLSLIDVIDQFNIDPDVEFPIRLGIPFEVVILWARRDLDKPGRGTCQLRIVNPSNEQIEFLSFEVDLTDRNRFRAQILVTGFPVNEFGRYLILVELVNNDGDNELVTQMPLEIIPRQPNEEDQ